MKCKLILFFGILMTIFCISITSCKKDATCGDGKQNGGERGIDCGDDAGLCPPCAAAGTCFDGIQNQGEQGVDCGGPCAQSCSTAPTCADGIQNGTETGIDCGGSCPACSSNLPLIATITNNGSASNWEPPLGNSTAVATGADTLLISGNLAGVQITIKYIGSFQAGNGLNAVAQFSNNGDTCADVPCTINFTTFDTAAKKITGSFAFTCTSTGGKSIQVSGTITALSYS